MDGCHSKKILILENHLTDWEWNTDMQSAAWEMIKTTVQLYCSLVHILAKNLFKPLHLNSWDLEIHVLIAWRDGYAGTASVRTIWSTSEQNYSNVLYVYCVETPWALSFSGMQKSVHVAVKHMMEGFVNTQAGFTKCSQILILAFQILSFSPKST